MSSSQTKIVLLTLGEELLLGITANAHLSYIGDRLRQGGARLYANLTISDAADEIAEQFPHYWNCADVVITTGGLGPTADDRTKEAIGELLGETLVFDTDTMDGIERRFAELGLPLTDNNRKQAYRFQNAKVIPNPNGTAPGLWLEKEGKLLIMLPGPPNELRPMFEYHVVPELTRRGLLNDAQNYVQIRTVGIGESILETRLRSVTDCYAGLDTAFCAHHGVVDVRLSFGRNDLDPKTLSSVADECRRALGQHFLCWGNASLVEVVSEILKRKQLTLAVAESCTGGLIANAFTDVPGASDFFLGSLTTYSNDAKTELLGVPEEMIQQHTAVSPEVAIAMAAGAAEKLESDYALSTTGYAGPTGGTEAAPVGTVFIGLYTPRGVWSKRRFFKGSRSVIKQRTLAAAVDWLRQELIGDVSTGDDATSALRAESKKILKSLE